MELHWTYMICSLFHICSKPWKWKWKVKVKSLSRVRLFATPWIVAGTRLLHPWDFPGKSTRVGCHFLLQGIFPTKGSNSGLPPCMQTLCPLSHQGSLAQNILKVCHASTYQMLIKGYRRISRLLDNKKSCLPSWRPTLGDWQQTS